MPNRIVTRTPFNDPIPTNRGPRNVIPNDRQNFVQVNRMTDEQRKQNKKRKQARMAALAKQNKARMDRIKNQAPKKKQTASLRPPINNNEGLISKNNELMTQLQSKNDTGVQGPAFQQPLNRQPMPQGTSTRNIAGVPTTENPITSRGLASRSPAGVENLTNPNDIKINAPEKFTQKPETTKQEAYQKSVTDFSNAKETEKPYEDPPELKTLKKENKKYQDKELDFFNNKIGMERRKLVWLKLEELASDKNYIQNLQEEIKKTQMKKNQIRERVFEGVNRESLIQGATFTNSLYRSVNLMVLGPAPNTGYEMDPLEVIEQEADEEYQRKINSSDRLFERYKALGQELNDSQEAKNDYIKNLVNVMKSRLDYNSKFQDQQAKQAKYKFDANLEVYKQTAAAREAAKDEKGATRRLEAKRADLLHKQKLAQNEILKNEKLKEQHNVEQRIILDREEALATKKLNAKAQNEVVAGNKIAQGQKDKEIDISSKTQKEIEKHNNSTINLAKQELDSLDTARGADRSIEQQKANETRRNNLSQNSTTRYSNKTDRISVAHNKRAYYITEWRKWNELWNKDKSETNQLKLAQAAHDLNQSNSDFDRIYKSSNPEKTKEYLRGLGLFRGVPTGKYTGPENEARNELQNKTNAILHNIDKSFDERKLPLTVKDISILRKKSQEIRDIFNKDNWSDKDIKKVEDFNNEYKDLRSSDPDALLKEMRDSKAKNQKGGLTEWQKIQFKWKEDAMNKAKNKSYAARKVLIRDDKGKHVTLITRDKGSGSVEKGIDIAEALANLKHIKNLAQTGYTLQYTLKKEGVKGWIKNKLYTSKKINSLKNRLEYHKNLYAVKNLKRFFGGRASDKDTALLFASITVNTSSTLTGTDVDGFELSKNLIIGELNKMISDVYATYEDSPQKTKLLNHLKEEYSDYKFNGKLEKFAIQHYNGKAQLNPIDKFQIDEATKQDKANNKKAVK